MTTYPLATLACTISSTGISAPVFEDILASYQAAFQGIYGSDVDIAENEQDGQWLGILSQAVYDSNMATIAAYNQTSPPGAVGVGLSSLVKLNAMRRLIPTYSMAVGQCVGQAGTPIQNGVVSDIYGNQWNLPSGVVIGTNGTVNVTVTCQSPGAINVGIGDINRISQGGVPGWQSFTNTAPSTPGAPVETDGQLRSRQSISTALPALTPREAVQAALANVTGVTRVFVFENDGNSINAIGIPPHCLAPVVQGGAVSDILNAIRLKKGPGAATYGSVSQIVYDSAGIPNTINYFPLQLQTIYYTITIIPLTGYVDTTETYILQSVAQHINTIPIGTNVSWDKLWASASLTGESAMTATGLTQPQLDALKSTYKITNIQIGTTSANQASEDVTIPFNYAAATSYSTNGTVLTTT